MHSDCKRQLKTEERHLRCLTMSNVKKTILPIRNTPALHVMPPVVDTPRLPHSNEDECVCGSHRRSSVIVTGMYSLTFSRAVLGVS